MPRLAVVVFAARGLLDDIGDARRPHQGRLDVADAKVDAERLDLGEPGDERRRIGVGVEGSLQIGGGLGAFLAVGGIPPPVGFRAVDLGETRPAACDPRR